MATIAPDGQLPAGPSSGFIAVNLIVCSVLWGSSYLFIKLMTGEVPALAIAASRGLLGGATLALWSLARGHSPLPRRGEILPWIVLGTTNGWLPNVLVSYALIELSSGPAAMIQAASPLITALAAHLAFAEERLTGRRLGGILLGFAGVALLIGPRLFEGGGTAFSLVAMFGSALSYAAANLYVRTLPAAAGNPARLALGQQMFSGAIATTLALAVLGPVAFRPFGGHLPAMLALGVFATAIPVVAFMRLIRAAGPTRAAMTGYLVPTVAVVLGVIVLHERLALHQLLGGCIILTGVFMVTMAPRRTGAA
ncbi:DMT family transporter [Bosea sp. (in: a-proteobacteria)]|uniref:DMT family transporter n=1 Tax=Bosea sp. (in: a-proteobacteria) TaxID=1871050 RepID=UPI002624E19A|nr:DMT family transporter [Bosea sp. (in: a-proteobacteria)]MCO5090112.1 DMT family transporter [Bosea sp. (in: a-proteobacteria)]